jgi:hypothetical protein
LIAKKRESQKKREKASMKNARRTIYIATKKNVRNNSGIKKACARFLQTPTS